MTLSLDEVEGEIKFKRLDPKPPQDEYHSWGCIRHFVMTKEEIEALTNPTESE